MFSTYFYKEILGEQGRIQQDVKDNKLLIRVATPGYPHSALEVSAVGEKLYIKGKKVEVQGVQLEEFSEELYDSKGQWDFQGATVDYNAGLLTIEVPARQDQQARKLTIRAGP